WTLGREAGQRAAQIAGKTRRRDPLRSGNRRWQGAAARPSTRRSVALGMSIDLQIRPAPDQLRGGLAPRHLVDSPTQLRRSCAQAPESRPSTARLSRPTPPRTAPMTRTYLS